MAFRNQSPSSAAPSGAPHDRVSVARNSERLGEREREVLDIVWTCGKATVGQVSCRLSHALAYTTVMTTLDRLFKKGLLHRTKQERAFLYSPALPPSGVESLRARAFLDHFFGSSHSSRDVLLSCLVDVLGSYDDELLCELEDKIRAAKQQLDANR